MLVPQISPTQPVDKTTLSAVLTAVGRLTPPQSVGSVSGREGKVRIYYKLETWFKASLSAPVSVEE